MPLPPQDIELQPMGGSRPKAAETQLGQEEEGQGLQAEPAEVYEEAFGLEGEVTDQLPDIESAPAITSPAEPSWTQDLDRRPKETGKGGRVSRRLGGCTWVPEAVSIRRSRRPAQHGPPSWRHAEPGGSHTAICVIDLLSLA